MNFHFLLSAVMLAFWFQSIPTSCCSNKPLIFNYQFPHKTREVKRIRVEQCPPTALLHCVSGSLWRDCNTTRELKKANPGTWDKEALRKTATTSSHGMRLGWRWSKKYTKETSEPHPWSDSFCSVIKTQIGSCRLGLCLGYLYHSNRKTY